MKRLESDKPIDNNDAPERGVEGQRSHGGARAERRDARDEVPDGEAPEDSVLDEEGSLDVAIRAAFAPTEEVRSDHHPAASTQPDGSGMGRRRSVLEIVGEHQAVPRVLLREVTEDQSSFVRPRVGRSTEYPDQIDRYAVLGEVARGGVGVVLRARDLDLGREVALKLLLNKHRGKADLTRRFLEEAQIGGQLQHPGIVPVHEIGLYDTDRPYLAMKLVRGQTLAELLDSRVSPADERQRYLNVFEQICQTLAFAHSKGVIHRDLKPSNVMVGPFGEVQVMDWGLAKVIPKGGIADEVRTTHLDAPKVSTWRSEEPGSNSMTGSIMGTPAYMPPEQATGHVESLDERSDVFGLGAILCEILTGEPPYVADNFEEVFRKAKAADLEGAVARLNACGADAELVELTKSCLRQNARERPRNAVVLAKKSEAYLESLEQWARELEMRATRTRLRLAVAVSVIVALVVGGAAYLHFDRERREQRDTARLAVNAASHHSERLRLQAVASGDLSLWEAALREAERAVDLAAPLERGGGRPQTDGATSFEALRATQRRLETEVKDQRVLATLEQLKQDRGSYSDDVFHAFRAVLSGYGIDIESTPISAAAETIGRSAIGSALILALDQWVLRQRGPLRRRLFEIAQAADSDAWRSRLRAAVMQGDEEELGRLAAEAEVQSPDPSTFELLASALDPRWRRRRGPSEDLETVEQLWRTAQRSHPGDFWINIRLGRFLRDAEKLDDALEAVRIAIALRPESAYAYYELGSVYLVQGEATATLEALTRSIVLDPDLPFGKAYWKLFDLLARRSGDLPREDIEALVRTLGGIAASGVPYHPEGLVQLLAAGQDALNHTSQAVLTLEAARRQRGAPRRGRRRFRGELTPAEQLERYRARLLPKLASYASIEAAAEREDGGNVLAAFRKQLEAESVTDVSHRLYLDARDAMRASRWAEAAVALREVVALDGTLPEPVVRLGECLRRLGDFDEVETLTREALLIQSNRSRELWDLWLQTSLGDLGRDAASLLATFPALDVVDDEGPRLNDYATDIRWLLNRLTQGAMVRINCGGEEVADAAGATWSRDRFFTTGSYAVMRRMFFGEIDGTENDALFQTNRWYSPRDASAGYRIPVAAGRYRGTLYFAEIHREASRGERRFSIEIEGRVVRESYAPGRKGFAVADSVDFETAVSDGWLDIRLRALQEHARISAISFERTN